ncbi:MAG TPA: ankyrin repeat domain-containing protein [Caulobacter sp.]|nr:ankyrin repeat domain-containing protein [Caulobacter sp.]
MPEQTPPRPLPDRPSAEHLRKQAKRLAREAGLRLAEAQRRLAADYGFGAWAQLMRRVAQLQPARDEDAAPLWRAIVADRPAADRLAAARALLLAGADARSRGGGETALHAAARLGPVALVELLIAHGAIEWEEDDRGRQAVDAGRQGQAEEREAIVELLDRPVIRDPVFRQAVTMVQAGDAPGLDRLLAAEPRLLRERILEPDCYRQAGRGQYFLDPKLFWFIANNPKLAPKMAPGMVEVAQAMIDRGAAADDIAYALELVMTSASARESGLQVPLTRTLLAAGARPSAAAIDGALAHRELEPMAVLLAAGHPLTAPMAAGLGRATELAGLLTPDTRQGALAMAVINDHADCVRLALAAGADPDAFMPVHSHSTPLHQAAANGDLAVIDLLLDAGARTDVLDALWHGTPLDWARHAGHEAAAALLEAGAR